MTVGLQGAIREVVAADVAGIAPRVVLWTPQVGDRFHIMAPAEPAEPPVLEGARVRLEPLTLDHLPGLCAAGADPALWRFTSTRVSTAQEMRAYVEAALEGQRDGTVLPFATVDRESGKVIGSTHFANIERAHRRAEIGWTWLAPAWQRTHANTEAKYLMLTHAFERWDLLRVELKTSAANAQSRAAILRLGAVEEGTLRRHMINPDGSSRDTVYFSILAEEWPAVRARLEARLGRA